MVMVNEISAGTLQAMPRSATEANRSSQPPASAATSTPAAETDRKEQKTPAATAQPSAEELEQAVNKANSFLQSVQRGLQFRVDKDTNTTVVKVVDSESGEVVRQIPPERTLEMLKEMSEMQNKLGSFLKESA
jgi:flagellar protein FlaG